MRVCGLSDVRLLLVNVSCAWAQIMHVCVWSNRRTFAAGECELCLRTNNACVCVWSNRCTFAAGGECELCLHVTMHVLCLQPSPMMLFYRAVLSWQLSSTRRLHHSHTSLTCLCVSLSVSDAVLVVCDRSSDVIDSRDKLTDITSHQLLIYQSIWQLIFNMASVKNTATTCTTMHKRKITLIQVWLLTKSSTVCIGFQSISG